MLKRIGQHILVEEGGEQGEHWEFGVITKVVIDEAAGKITYYYKVLDADNTDICGREHKVVR